MGANGGMSMSNHFQVAFEYPGGDNRFEFLCDEAQLPNTQAATGTIKGRHMGEGEINYPHTRIFTEMQLGFQCDADMSPLKFLNKWYANIFHEFGDYAEGGIGPYSAMEFAPDPMPDAAKRVERIPNRTVSMHYPEEYCGRIWVTKTELGSSGFGGVRTSLTYVMENAWPFAIDAVPLQFGTAQITKVTAQFYYSKHYVVTNRITTPPSKDLALNFLDSQGNLSLISQQKS